MAKKKDSSKVWSIMSLAAGIGGATVARKGLNAGWKAATGKQPPGNPADPEVDLKEGLAWAAFSGVCVGIARMAFGRRAANYYAKSTGHLPPGMGKESAEKSEAEKRPTKA